MLFILWTPSTILRSLTHLTAQCVGPTSPSIACISADTTAPSNCAEQLHRIGYTMAAKVSIGCQTTVQGAICPREHPIQTERASSVSSSSAGSSTCISETSDQSHSETGSNETIDENHCGVRPTSTLQYHLAKCEDDHSNGASILAERAVANIQQPVAIIDGKLEGSVNTSHRGKRRNRQGQKSKEAYNRKRREKKKNERRERAAAARQSLTSGHAL